MGRRLAPVVVAWVALAGACGGSGSPPSAGPGGTDAAVTTAVTTTVPRGQEPPATSSPAGTGTTTGPATTGAPTATSTTTGPPGPDPRVPPGQFGDELLGSRTGDRLVVEILAQSGAAPVSTTVDHLRAVLGEVSGKRVDVPTRAVGGGARAWTADDLIDLADTEGREPQGGGQVVMRLLFVRGRWAESDTVLGVAVRGDVAAVFSDRVAASTTLGLGASAIERAVATHEVGHLLGLVDLLLNTGRQDPEHPGHSPNRESVMYWAVESSLIGQILEGGPPDTFDGADRADLAAIRAMGS